jgi:Tfp pilus assembly protein PilV
MNRTNEKALFQQQSGKPRAKRADTGFTLIETTIAMMVMMVAALSAAALFLYAITNNTGGSERAMAMAVAQQQIEQIRSVRYDDATLAPGTTNLPDATMAGRRYGVTRTVTVQSNPSDNTSKFLKIITITVTPHNETRQWIRSPVSLTTHRSATTQGKYAIP